MFTINIYLRFALMLGGLIIGLGLTFWPDLGFWYGFPFLLVSVVLTVGYVMLGTIQSSGMLMQEQRFDEAEERLKLTFFPKALFTTNKGFYHVIKGTIAAQKKDFNTAEEAFLKAENAQYPSDNEKASVLLNLAGMYLQRRKIPQAKNYLRKIKKLNITQSLLKEQVQMIEDSLKQSGNMSMGNQQLARQMGRKGGFRQPKKSKQ